MKKITSILLAVAMTMTFAVGCSGSDENKENNNPETGQETGDKTESSDLSWDKEVDVLVVGAGGAGLASAVEAADNGAENILIIEKMPMIGGTTFISQGLIAGFNTEVAKAAGIEYEEDELYDLLMNNADYKLDPELTRITVAKSGETIDWLQNTVKMDFVDEVNEGYGPLKMMHMVDGMGGGMKEPFLNALEERNVEIMLETPGKELISDENGDLVGVLAEKDGEDFKIKAKSIILATGGYADNAELAGTLNPMYKGIYGIGWKGTTGDGIIMASNKGAAISNSNHLMAVLKDQDILENHDGDTNTASVSRFVAGPNAIFINKDGQRFMDEKSGGFMSQKLNEPILDQMHKDGTDFVWTICDQANIDATEAKRGKDLEFTKADTIEELAELMNVDPVALKETVENYNKMAEEELDSDFGRSEELNPLDNAPYYAVPVVPAHIITYGGILRNENGEVLRADNTVIPGLYTAGETSSNSAYMGFTLSNCFTWGRIAGKSAAENAK
ncbi:MAG: FAD-dependent oxidoreductase [Clostridium sp.]|nr:FAD-dependent oxidoreductase [Clostridium sp.]